MSIKITYFVHGTTTDNEHDLATGWAPGVLSELGKQQAKDLGQLVADKKFDVVFCSDLQRSIDSAELGFGDKYKIIHDKRLREANYGNHTQKEAKVFKNNMNDFIDTPFPDGESYKDVEKRIGEFCEYLKTNYNGKHIAIVAHQAPQLALDIILRGKTWKQAIEEDWRHTKSWQPGWEYEIKD
ncbi:MAG: histidine phosphatase family protein [Methanoregula sp.]|jgi:broad specificity phosphatase PhoE|nr:histidine phosphatase family protein [Methanoregula sp.]